MTKVKNGSRSRALIVEDEFLIALDLEAAMSGLGFEICGLAPNAEEARALAMDHQPDVVLVDVYLGGVREGIETARWLREVCDASVVFVTAHTDSATVERIKAMAATHFGVDPAGIDVDQPIATLGADSLGYLEFLFELEDAFSIVIEAVAEPLARRITEQVAVPTIGIGASAACDGQILVLEDMLGLSPRVPKFVKRYGDIGPGIEAAVAGYAKDVRERAFPGADHVYMMKKS